MQRLPNSADFEDLAGQRFALGDHDIPDKFVRREGSVTSFEGLSRRGRGLRVVHKHHTARVYRLKPASMEFAYTLPKLLFVFVSGATLTVSRAAIELDRSPKDVVLEFDERVSSVKLDQQIEPVPLSLQAHRRVPLTERRHEERPKRRLVRVLKAHERGVRFHAVKGSGRCFHKPCVHAHSVTGRAA